MTDTELHNRVMKSLSICNLYKDIKDLDRCQNTVISELKESAEDKKVKSKVVKRCRHDWKGKFYFISEHSNNTFTGRLFGGDIDLAATSYSEAMSEMCKLINKS